MTLVLAIPSKGRLRAPTEARLENAGHPAAAPTARSYATRLEGLPGVQLLLVEAAAIPGVLARGEGACRHHRDGSGDRVAARPEGGA